MSPLQGIVLFLNWFGAGLLQPILSLLLLSRGCTIQTLPLALGVYSLTVLVLEVPSGVFADWRGRRTTFLASLVFYLISFALMLSARAFSAVAAAMVAQGAGRAFSSGSLDALIIDGAVARLGEGALPRVSAQLMVLQSAGVALGALLGGFLPESAGFRLHLVVRVVLLILTGLLGGLFLREDLRPGQGRPGLRDQLAQSAALLHGNRPFWSILCCMTALAGLMALVETYWQPAFKDLVPAGPNWQLSLLCTGGFLLTTLVSLLTGRIKAASLEIRWSGYFTLQISLGGAALLLALPLGPIGFIGGYLLFYALLGAGNIQEQTLLNTLSGSASRATVLSVASLACQLGALGFNTASSALVVRVGFGGVWALAGIALTVVSLAACFLRKRPVRRSGSPPPT